MSNEIILNSNSLTYNQPIHFAFTSKLILWSFSTFISRFYFCVRKSAPWNFTNDHLSNTSVLIQKTNNEKKSKQKIRCIECYFFGTQTKYRGPSFEDASCGDMPFNQSLNGRLSYLANVTVCCNETKNKVSFLTKTFILCVWYGLRMFVRWFTNVLTHTLN